SWVEAGEADDALYFVVATRERPKTTADVFYGIDLGPSHIGFASFGPGTEFVYRAEITKGTLTLQDKATGKALPAPKSAVFIGDVIELKLAKADLPSLAAVTNVAARPYAADFTHAAN